MAAARSVDRASVSQLARPIQEVQVGDEVWGENPGQPDDLTLGHDIDPPNRRKLTLDAPKKDGSRAAVTLLRPVAWLREQVDAAEGAFDPESVVGQVVTISVPECGIDGEATLLQVEPCPAVKSTRIRNTWSAGGSETRSRSPGSTTSTHSTPTSSGPSQHRRQAT